MNAWLQRFWAWMSIPPFSTIIPITGPRAVMAQGLHLGVGDRDRVRETTDSRELADFLLLQASVKAKEVGVGETVTVEIESPYHQVHFLELTLSLSMMAGRYGLAMEHLFDNTLTFRRVA